MPWAQIGDNVIGEFSGDKFGGSISLSDDGSIIAIGAPDNDGNGKESGHVRVFKNTMNALGMNYQELFELYIGKNTLNRFRQNNGYKEGLYQKTWSGKEDNEHLIEILSGLDSEPESLAAQLYSALEARYQSAAL